MGLIGNHSPKFAAVELCSEDIFAKLPVMSNLLFNRHTSYSVSGLVCKMCFRSPRDGSQNKSNSFAQCSACS